MPNPTGNYSRVKTWGTTDTVLASDLNAEFDNVLNNFNPEMLAHYSQNVAQMQIQTSPGAIGTESLATSLAGEIERLRFMINAITGNTYWYTSPVATLSQLNSLIGASAFGNRINTGKTTGTTGSTQPNFLTAAGGSTATVTLKATTTSFGFQVSGTNYTISADTALTGLTLAPGSNNTATVNDLTLAQAGTQSSQLIGENGTQITVSSMGSNISSQASKFCAFKTTAGEYLLGYVESTTQITNCYRGFFFDSTNTIVSRGTLSNGDTLTLMKLGWIFATTAGSVSVTYNNPYSGGVAPASPAVNDYWLDTSTNIWKNYTGSVWTTANATLIGMSVQDTSGCVATRSFDFFGSYSDLNNIELFTDAANSGTIVRSRLPGAQISVYGILNVFSESAYVLWDASVAMDTGSQTASTMYYFYLDTNGRAWISKTAPHDRRNDLRGYYHPSNPWRCFGYAFSNANTKFEVATSFFKGDDTTQVANMTAAQNNAILSYNIVQREQVITLDGSQGSYTLVLPAPVQMKGKYVTYVRTDDTLANTITLQSWGTQAVAAITGTLSVTASQTTLSGASSTTSVAAGQLITGVGIHPNTTVSSTSAGKIIMSQNAVLTTTSATVTIANAAGYGGTVGQQTNYVAYGINGAFTVTLNTQYELYTLTSDGNAYYIVNHRAVTPWINAGLTSLTTTGGTVSKGTTSSDSVTWRRVGRNMEMRVDYVQTGAGTQSTGATLFLIPGSQTIDTNVLNANTAVTVAVGTGILGACGHGYIQGSAGGFLSMTPMAYDSTHLKFFGGATANGNGNIWGSTAPGAFTQSNWGATFFASVPILGWTD